MKARCDEFSLHMFSTTTDAERTYRWEKTRPSHDRFNHTKSGQSCPCVRSVVCTTATNDKQPETTENSPSSLSNCRATFIGEPSVLSSATHELKHLSQKIVQFNICLRRAFCRNLYEIFDRHNCRRDRRSAARIVASQPARCQGEPVLGTCLSL